MYVVKNDKKFRDYFKIDENLDVPITTVKRGTISAAGAAVAPTTKYISFLSQAKAKISYQ